jgi:hypothetical protein
MHDEEMHLIGDSEGRTKRSIDEDEEMRFSPQVDQTNQMYNTYDQR